MPSSAARDTRLRTAARFCPAALRAASCRAAAFFAAARRAAAGAFRVGWRTAVPRTAVSSSSSRASSRHWARTSRSLMASRSAFSPKKTSPS